MSDTATIPAEPKDTLPKGPVSKATAKALREERAELINRARAFHNEREDEQGLLAAEDQATFDEMMGDIHLLEDHAKNREKRESLDKIAADLSKPVEHGDRFTPDPNAAPDDGQRRDSAQVIMVRNGYSANGKPRYEKVGVGKFGDRGYSDIFSRYLRTGKFPSAEFAALRVDDSERAGFLVASEQFASGLLKEVDDQVHIRRLANVITVREAKTLGIRARTSKAATFDWSSELTVSDKDTALKYGKRSLEPHPLTGQIEVSRDLLRQSVVGIEGEVRMELARDGGEIMEQAYLTGDGNQKPLGLFVASSNGIPTSRDVLTGSATGLTYDGMVNAKMSLKAAYRRQGGERSGAAWLLHRDAIARTLLIKDGEGRPIFLGAHGEDAEDTILGLPVLESEFAPNTFTAGQYVGILGNFFYYAIADSLDLEIQVLTELEARRNVVAYIARLKTDGMPVLSEAFARLKTN